MKILCRNFYVLAIFGLFLACQSQEKTKEFWDTQRRGANTFAVNLSLQTIKTAKDYDIGFLRIAPDKWPTQARDFLIGNADKYEGLVADDLALLKEKLDDAVKYDLPIMLTMISLPGSRWRQNNNGKDDLRLWENSEYEDQAIAFWRDLARELLSYKNIVGFNILNEPHLDRLYHGEISQKISLEQKKEIQQKLGSFYARTIDAIHEVDPSRFIILDASWYGDARTMEWMQVFDDPKIIYSFHMYEPYSYTNYQLNQGKYTYPNDLELREGLSPEVYFAQFFDTVKAFQQKHKIPSDRIMAGEFGVNRLVPGAQQYLSDLIAIFNENNWHWALYAFRDLDWDGMDYELGMEKLPWTIWDRADDNGELPLQEFYVPNKLFDVIKKGWQGELLNASKRKKVSL